MLWGIKAKDPSCSSFQIFKLSNFTRSQALQSNSDCLWKFLLRLKLLIELSARGLRNSHAANCTCLTSVRHMGALEDLQLDHLPPKPPACKFLVLQAEGAGA